MRFLLFTFLLVTSSVKSQDLQQATLFGTVQSNFGKPIAFASLILKQSGQTVKDTITDMNGNFYWSLAPGKYDLEIKAAEYVRQLITGIPVFEDHMFPMDIRLSKSEEYKFPEHGPTICVSLIDFEPGNTGTRFSYDQLRRIR